MHIFCILLRKILRLLFTQSSRNACFLYHSYCSVPSIRFFQEEMYKKNRIHCSIEKKHRKVLLRLEKHRKFLSSLELTFLLCAYALGLPSPYFKIYLENVPEFFNSVMSVISLWSHRKLCHYPNSAFKETMQSHNKEFYKYKCTNHNTAIKSILHTAT